MTAFNPSTSYAKDYELADFVERATWEYGSEPTQVANLKAQRGAIDTPDLISVAAGLGLSSDAAAIVVWQATASTTFAPKPGHVLQLATSGRWVIRAIDASQFGQWTCLCTKEVTNADVV